MERKTAKVGTCALWAMRREATLAGLVSGTVSDRTGGSFANGFVSGFYQNIFNNQGERKRGGGRTEAGKGENGIVGYDDDGVPIFDESHRGRS